jgi:hypothetical protein
MIYLIAAMTFAMIGYMVWLVAYGCGGTGSAASGR